MKKGKFIVFEGLNGSGKGNPIKNLTNYIYDLSKEGTIFRTREPNALFDKNGEKAREMLKSEGDPYKNGLLAIELFAKNRLAHNKVFGPLLEKGVDVICDRYYYSNFAYQHAQGISYEKIAEKNKDTIKPDLTFILNTTAEESARRLIKRGHARRKFDLHNEFNSKVLDNYLELGEILPKLIGDNSIVYIDGMKSIDEVWEEVKSTYNSKFH